MLISKRFPKSERYSDALYKLPVNSDHKPTPAERERLQGDRLCYLTEGMDGLRTRHGMQSAYGRAYVDAYDTQAQREGLQPAKMEIED